MMYDMKYMVENNHRLTNPKKTYRILESNGIRTWKELVPMSRKDIQGIKGIGPTISRVLYKMARDEESMNPQKYFKAKEI